MRTVIAGLGSIGRRHLRNLKTLGETDFILYRTQQATLPDDDDLAGQPVITNLRDTFDMHPDAFIISNPTSMHLSIALTAAEAGCHILIEKPISDSLENIDYLIELAKKSGSHILVGYQFRFHPTLKKAAELLKGGRIGRILSAHAHWGEYLPDWHPWEDYRQSYAARPELGGGVLLTLSHPFDYLCWLCGTVNSIWAFTTSQGLRLPVEDTAEIGLSFQSGAIGNVHLDYNQKPTSHHLDIVGTNGTLHWDNATGQLRIYNPSGNEWQDFYPPEGFERNHMFLDEIRHFLDVIQGKAEPICTIEDGKLALKIALSARISSDKGKIINLQPG